jgi:methyltransferase (TIGR00027 family)
VDSGCPSRTALRVALRRAAHQLYDARPLVFDDPLAVRILGRHAAEVERTPGRFANYKPRPHSVALRAFILGRSRYAEGLLARAVAGGVTQYVVLGAGLDTFAHRNAYPGLRVYEVDRCATQQWKRELLAQSGLPRPEGLTYVPMDFEQQSLAAELASAGLNRERPVFFSWLGVVPYITLEAFQSTLGFVGSQTVGSGIVMDYAQPRASLPPLEQRARDSLASRVRLSGEEFKLFFTPEQIATELAGFRDIEDLGSRELNASYFSSRADRLKLLGEGSRIVSAWV